MKKYLLTITLALAGMIVLCSFGTSLPTQFERFADKVARNYADYTEEDWNKASEQFGKLMDKYEESYNSFSEEDKVRIDKAIGRYRAIVFRSGMNKAMESFNEYVKDLEPKIKSLTRRLESFLDELTRDVSPGN